MKHQLDENVAEILALSNMKGLAIKFAQFLSLKIMIFTTSVSK